MSFSFIVVDKHNNIDANELSNFLNKNYTDYEVLFCSAQTNNSINKFKFFNVDKSENVEAILNAVTALCTKQNIVVIRQLTSFENLKKLTDGIKTPNTIVCYKKHYSGIKGFFCNLFNKLAKLFYAKSITYANHACVAFGTNPSCVLKQLECPSNLMRSFSWSGATVLQIDGEKNYKLSYSKTENALKTFVPLGIMAVLLVVFFIFRAHFDLLTNIVIWLSVFICIVLSLLFGTNWFIKTQIGENITGKATIKQTNY
ncbi:MAG: hypothetical protein IJ318_01435 [Clostridia bacterium]|nr:hypothetical protein [Clostridia bacterium]